MSDINDNLPSIEDYRDNQDELPSISDFITEEGLPSVEEFVEKKEEGLRNQSYNRDGLEKQPVGNLT